MNLAPFGFIRQPGDEEMRNTRFTRKVAALAVSSTMATAVLMGAPNVALADDGDSVTASEVVSALNNVEAANDGLVAEPVKSTTDSDSAAVVVSQDSTLEVPKDPADGVSLGADGTSPVTIELPNAAEAKDATKLTDGTVVYPGADGSANAVIPVNGGVQMVTTIADANAPTQFPYKVDVPAGGKVVVNEDGSAAVLDAEGSTVLAIPTPWATDAAGVSVPTRFTTDGQTLTQVVDHTSGAFAYPVVADPVWLVPVVIVGVVRTAFAWCGIGALSNAAWQIFWNGWVWSEVRRAGKQGCVEGVVGRFVPWGKVKGLIKR
jgi:hypothetical protein